MQMGHSRTICEKKSWKTTFQLKTGKKGDFEMNFSKVQNVYKIIFTIFTTSTSNKPRKI